jgi:hypothetical protein
MPLIEGRVAECTVGHEGRLVVEATITGGDELDFRPGRPVVVHLDKRDDSGIER